MSEIYLHQVFSGRRNPSRDRLLCLCIGLGCSLEETQRLLQQASYAQLYPRIKRDAIISHGILHGTELNEINDKLFSENEKDPALTPERAVYSVYVCGIDSLKTKNRRKGVSPPSCAR